MSKGSTIVPVRFPHDKLKQLLDEVHRYNANPLNSELSVSDFIRAAVREKIDHLTRSRSRRQK